MPRARAACSALSTTNPGTSQLVTSTEPCAASEIAFATDSASAAVQASLALGAIMMPFLPSGGTVIIATPVLWPGTRRTFDRSMPISRNAESACSARSSSPVCAKQPCGHAKLARKKSHVGGFSSAHALEILGKQGFAHLRTPFNAYLEIRIDAAKRQYLAALAGAGRVLVHLFFPVKACSASCRGRGL